MPHDLKLLDHLESLERASWSGTVFRYTPTGKLPDRENTFGARWNPPGLGAIYTALERETALAELHHFVESLDPWPSRLQITLYTLSVSVDDICDLGTLESLRHAGITSEELRSADHDPCRKVGAAASWLGAGGVIVPSARIEAGRNLVIYPVNQPPDYTFNILDQSPVDLSPFRKS